MAAANLPADTPQSLPQIRKPSQNDDGSMKPESIEAVDDCSRHLRNSLARQSDRLPKGMRALITALMSMYGRERLGGGDTLQPKTADLCKRTKASERTVQGHMRSLINWGFVVPVKSRRGAGKANIFTLNVNALIRVMMDMGYRFSMSLVTKIRDVAEAIKTPFAKRKRVQEMGAKKPAVFSRPIYKLDRTVPAEGSDRAISKINTDAFGLAAPGKLSSRLLAAALGQSFQFSCFDMAGSS